MPPEKEPPPTHPNQAGLLDKLRKITDSSLEGSVEKTEGVNGSTVEPIYSARKMRCYSVTESELRQINLANIGITAFSSIGSALLAFGLDIFKDTVLAEKVPESAQIVVSYVQPIVVFFGILFWLCAGAALWWRRDMIKLIKQESISP